MNSAPHRVCCRVKGRDRGVFGPRNSIGAGKRIILLDAVPLLPQLLKSCQLTIR